METTQQVLGFWAWYAIGFLGILLYIGFKALESGGTRVDFLVTFVRDNSLSIVLNVLSYTALTVWWYYQGLDFLGLEKGKMGAVVIILAFSGSSFFRSIADRFQKKTPQEGRDPVQP